MKEFDRFSKHHPKHRHKLLGPEHVGFVQSLVETEQLVPSLSILTESQSAIEWAVRVSTTDGPPHNQLRNAIILNQLCELIRKLNGVDQIETIPLIGTSPKEYSFEYPMGLPTSILAYLNAENQEEAVDWIGEGPFHEVAADTLIMTCLASIAQKIDRLTDLIK